MDRDPGRKSELCRDIAAAGPRHHDRAMRFASRVRMICPSAQRELVSNAAGPAMAHSATSTNARARAQITIVVVAPPVLVSMILVTGAIACARGSFVAIPFVDSASFATAERRRRRSITLSQSAKAATSRTKTCRELARPVTPGKQTSSASGDERARPARNFRAREIERGRGSFSAEFARLATARRLLSRGRETEKF